MDASVDHINIIDYLPHRAPLLMVDKLLNINESYVTTVFTVLPDCIFVENGKLIETGLIENAAQTCSTIVGKSLNIDDNDNPTSKNIIGFISLIKKINIHDLPSVNQTIRTEAELLSRFDTDAYSICTMKCKISQNDSILLYCEMNLFIQEAVA